MDQRLLDSLLQPDAYPEKTSTVQLVQTHVSYLFLTDKYVYKIKKPVDFGFLNFSTIDRRRFYCHEEVRLNQRLCPDIYLGVVEVREAPGGASLTGTGRTLDYAVKMKRLPAGLMLDRLLENDQVEPAAMIRIARTVGRFHLAAEQNEGISSFGSIATLRSNWDENFLQATALIPDCLTNRDLTLIRGWAEQFLTENRRLLEDRAKDGYIRDCDGDIHLENICLDEQVYIFDCIEFNHRFRYSDTAADIAFLLMDLDFHHRSDLGRVFLDEYQSITGDRQASVLLDFYKAYRAFIRGKVAGLQWRDSQISPEDRTTARVRASRYFHLARGYIVRQKLPQTLFITCGLMGSGKSVLTRELAMELGLIPLSSDLTRKRLAGIPPTTRISDTHDDGLYSPEANAATYRELLQQAEAALNLGQSVIIDATFRRRSDRRLAADLADRVGVDFRILHLTPPEQLIRERLSRRLSDPQAISDGRPELLALQQQEFAHLQPDEGATVTLTGDRPITASTDQILEALHLI